MEPAAVLYIAIGVVATLLAIYVFDKKTFHATVRNIITRRTRSTTYLELEDGTTYERINTPTRRGWRNIESNNFYEDAYL